MSNLSVQLLQNDLLEPKTFLYLLPPNIHALIPSSPSFMTVNPLELMRGIIMWLQHPKICRFPRWVPQGMLLPLLMITKLKENTWMWRVKIALLDLAELTEILIWFANSLERSLNFLSHAAFLFLILKLDFACVDGKFSCTCSSPEY